MTREQLEQQFNDGFPEGFLKEVVRTIFSCYREAPGLVAAAGVVEPFARWELPFKRRALIQGRVAALASGWAKQGEGSVKGHIERARSGGGPYALVTAGPFHLTLSMIDQIDELPRVACFRKEKSKACNPSLFDDPEDSTEKDTYYAVLADLPHPTEDRPAAIRIKFPDADYCSTFHHIDLLDRFAWLFESEPVQEETIKEPEPKLREDLGKQDADSDGQEEKVG